MEWTPRRISAVLFMNGKLHREAMREQLTIQTMAARGDPKAVEKAIKADP